MKLHSNPLAALCCVLIACLGGAWFSTPAQAAARSAQESAAQAQVQDPALARYRAADYASAETLWLEALQDSEAGPERGRLAYNLGNVAYRRGKTLEAVGWYTAGLRYLPRDGDLWANLELARAEADLPPADGGGLVDMLRRLMGKFTLGESRLLALAGVLLLAGMLLGEALRGGSSWALASLVALCLLPLFFAPWVRHALATPGAHLVVRGGSGGRSEPRMDAQRLAVLEAGEEVGVFDAFPGWKRVRMEDELELWVQADALFDLER